MPELYDDVPVVPWFRGIYADGEPAGFLMTTEVTDAHPLPYLWRLLIDRRHQGRGIGSRALRVLIDRYRAEGCAALTTSWADVPGGPEPFYRGLGFVPTGELDDEEVVGRLEL